VSPEIRKPASAGRRSAARQVLTLLALVATLFVTACESRQAGTDRSALRIAVPNIPPAIGNPYQGVTVPPTLALQAVFDTLTGVDERGSPTPGLALAWRELEPLVWEFELRPGVRFSNGEVFDARALVVSLEHMQSKRGRGETIGSMLPQIERIETLAPLRVRIHLNEPDPLLPLHASVWRVPAPAHWKSLKLPAGARFALGSGPYVIAARGDGRLLLRENPLAWRKPATPVIELLMIPDKTARLQAFISGAVDMALVVSFDDRAAAVRGGGRMVPRATTLVDFLGFRTLDNAGTPLADPRVRRALNMAVNRELLTRYLLGDATRPASQLNVPGGFGFDPSLPPLPYDPAGARRLLAAAGYPQGLTLTMAVTTGEVAGDALYYQQIGTDLAAIGVRLETRSRPPSRQLQEVFSGNIGADLFSWNTRGLDLLMDFRHRSCLKPSESRRPFHCDPQLTSQLRTAMTEEDAALRLAHYRAIAAYERDHPPGILLWQRPDFDVIGADIDGYAPIQDHLHLERIHRRAASAVVTGASR
jgi:peptide/nickel transport system substrate-binding protein